MVLVIWMLIQTIPDLGFCHFNVCHVSGGYTVEQHWQDIQAIQTIFILVWKQYTYYDVNLYFYLPV